MTNDTGIINFTSDDYKKLYSHEMRTQRVRFPLSKLWVLRIERVRLRLAAIYSL